MPKSEIKAKFFNIVVIMSLTNGDNFVTSFVSCRQYIFLT